MGVEDVEAGGFVQMELPEAPAEREGLKPIAETTPVERATGVVAGAAVGTSVAAMIFEQSPIVIVAGVLSSALGPYAYYQQTRLTDIAALKETHEAVQREVNRLETENERLSQSVQTLASSVERLEDVEQALDVITATQGQNVSLFEEQVAENRNILAKMQNNLKANVLQNLLSVIIRSDTDGDFQISPTEQDALIKRVQTINGVELHEDRFRAAIQKSGGSLQAVMDVVKNLLSDEVSKEDEIFTLTES
jgi:hypothetical protein